MAPSFNGTFVILREGKKTDEYNSGASEHRVPDMKHHKLPGGAEE